MNLYRLPFRKTLTPAASAVTLSPPIDLAGEPISQNLSSLYTVCSVPAFSPSQLPAGESLTFTLVNAATSSLSPVMTTTPMGTIIGGTSGGATAFIAISSIPGIGGQLGMQIAASGNVNAAGIPLNLLIAATQPIF